MWGDSESASKNTSDLILKIRKERFLIFPLACDLVLALLGRLKAHGRLKNRGRTLFVYHARMARRAQHLRCSLSEGSERADNRLDKLFVNFFML